MSKNLKVYDASAGSGKTYTLADKYSEYLLAEYDKDHTAHRHVLAVTFTNKATLEMKQRIIDRLLEISREDPSPSKRDKAKKIICSIVHDYTMFKVSTIDSFFQRVLKSFAVDLGKRCAFETILDPDGPIESSVESMYSKIGSDNSLRALMKEMALSRIDNGENWNWRDVVLSRGAYVAKLEYQELKLLSGVAPGALASSAPVFRNRAKVLETIFVEKLKGLSVEKERSLEESGLVKDIFQGQSNSPVWKFLSSSPYVNKEAIAACPEIVKEWLDASYHDVYFKDIASASDKRTVEDLMNKYATDIKDLYDKYYAEYVTLSIVIPNLRETVLLDYISKELDDYLEKEQLTLLSKSPQLLQDLINGSDAPFIYEKTGAAINHYLLDEFQDTSTKQWDNFRPLLKEGVANNYESMLVGDVKQSIYRWRGGDWNLFSKKVPKQFIGYDKKDLNTNYRSLSNIVNFNNYLFSSSNSDKWFDDDSDEPGFLVNAYSNYLKDRGCRPDYCEEVIDIYRKSAQKVKEKYKVAEQQGVVDIICCPPDKNGNIISSDEFILYDLASKIKSLTEGENPIYKLGDIAVLSHKNENCSYIAEFLIKNGISIVSCESLLVSSNLYVSLLVEALRKIDNPSSTGFVALAKVSSAKIKNAHLLDADTANGALYIKNLLTGKTLYEICKEVIRVFLPEIKGSDTAFLDAFLDKVLEYTFSFGTSVSGFLKWWDDNSAKLFIPEPSDSESVKIMTMHKAKGLGFLVVFIPFLREKLVPDDGEKWFLPDNGKNLLGYTGPLLLNFKTSSLKNSIFANNYKKEQMEGCVDNLNLAYVSFTRPKERLYIYASRNRKGCLSTEIGAFCRSNGNLFNTQKGRISAEDVKNGILKGIQADDSKAPFEFTEYIIGNPLEKSYAKLHPETGIELYCEEDVNADGLSSLLGNEIQVSKLRGYEEDDDNVRRGVLWHQLYSMIEEVGEGENGLGEAVGKAVDRFLKKNPGSLLGDDKEKLVSDVSSKISSIASLGWFDADKKVMNEVSILSGTDMWRPDRVLLPADDSKDWAQVVDYKFGLYEKDSPKHRLYVNQVKNYMKLLREMGYSDVKGWLWYVLEDKVEEVEGFE